MNLANVDFHDLRPDEQDAVRSLILEGLGEHWGSVDPTLNPDLDDLAVTYAAGRILVATDDGTVVGTGTVIRRDATTAEIVRMSVIRTYRRTGLGRRLVEELVATARGWGMSRVVLETSAHWTEVVEFYVRCGFTQTHFESGSFGRDAWFEVKWDCATLREASSSDDADMDAIAREGDASADAEYLALVRSQAGRLLVAESAGRVVAYGGVVDIDGVAMLCDLFVAADARGMGIGTRLLDELFNGSTGRMTFSSKHPAAHAAYRRAGMEPQWRLLYLRGAAIGGGAELPVGQWRHGRAALVEQMARQGAHVSSDVVWMPEGNGVWIARLESDRPVEVLAAALAGLTAGTVVTMCTPEHSAVARWAQDNGFAVSDYDTFCATPDALVPADLHCLDPGLA